MFDRIIESPTWILGRNELMFAVVMKVLYGAVLFFILSREVECVQGELGFNGYILHIIY